MCSLSRRTLRGLSSGVMAGAVTRNENAGLDIRLERRFLFGFTAANELMSVRHDLAPSKAKHFMILRPSVPIHALR